MAPETLANRPPGVAQLLGRASRALGLKLCLHDRLGLFGLPKEWTTHIHPACLKQKARHQDRCIGFDNEQVHRDVRGNPQGEIHVCPFGYTEIAVPVQRDGLLVGVLFAGPCRTGDRLTEQLDLPQAPDRQWLEDRRAMVALVARQLEALWRDRRQPLQPGRRQAVLEYINRNLARTITLDDLARLLSLSPSRTGHVIRDLFGATTPELVNRIRLQEAVYLLTCTDMPIGLIAARLGYRDQNYFSRLFSKTYSQSPRQFRRQHTPQA